MSVQSDIELLSIEAAEEYSRRNNMSIEEVYKLFHRHQIFEKIVLQHEYLHQVSYDEITEFVCGEIQKNHSDMIVFHGTDCCFENIRLEKSHNKRDFGKGFYTTILQEQAKEWAYRLSQRKNSKEYYVMKFVFEENELLKTKRFDRLDEEWLEFIKENRSKGGVQHDYDVVIGPVADDNTMETVQLYLTGVLNSNEAVERLRYNKVNNQVSFHTEKSLEFLKFVGRERYE